METVRRGRHPVDGDQLCVGDTLVTVGHCRAIAELIGARVSRVGDRPAATRALGAWPRLAWTAPPNRLIANARGGARCGSRPSWFDQASSAWRANSLAGFGLTSGPPSVCAFARNRPQWSSPDRCPNVDVRVTRVQVACTADAASPGLVQVSDRQGGLSLWRDAERSAARCAWRSSCGIVLIVISDRLLRPSPAKSLPKLLSGPSGRGRLVTT